MPEKILIVFSDRQPKNHSVRWNSDDNDACISSIYIRKPMMSEAKKIQVTVEEVE